MERDPLPRPTLFLATWGRLKQHGPGRKWAYWPKPSRREGRIPALEPRGGISSLDDCQGVLSDELRTGHLAPGALYAIETGNLAFPEPQHVLLANGDSILCTPQQDKQGLHAWDLTVLTPFLLMAGWNVVLRDQMTLLGADGTLGVLGARVFAYGCREWWCPFVKGGGGGLVTATDVWPTASGWSWEAWAPSTRSGGRPWDSGETLGKTGEALKQAESAAEAAIQRLLRQGVVGG